VHVTVFTPGAMLGETLQQLVRDRIKAALGKEAVVAAEIDPEMIGGIKLRIGDRLIDGSVATRLRRMRQSAASSKGTWTRPPDRVRDAARLHFFR
jgi:F-type H+-transporting ATPase subunit delta